uniref:Small ribosomal subunit protein uS3c n=1 Tax=Neglectella solitaria TaxID=120749 RepID=C7BEE7_NEGSO|nr:ribosomal protein S3 [Neglectella solitaria]
MGQKVNPLGFRLGITQKHKSQWFMKVPQYSQLSVEDFFLRKIISNKFLEAKITEITVQRKLDQIRIEIQAAETQFITGRDGSQLDEFKKELEKELRTFRKNNFYFYKNIFSESIEKPQLSLHVIKKSNPNFEAAFLAEFLVEEIQKRTPFRRAIKQTIQLAQKAKVKGIKIQISGRLNGAEIARTEWVRQGRVPLQTLRATIDYSYRTAKTIYGIIGIKIWVFKG